MQRLTRRLLLRFFDLLYTDLAWAYDLVSWVASGGLWYEWTFVAEQFVTDEPILEVGVGRGRLLRRLVQRYGTVIGVDVSPQMIDAAQRRIEEAGRVAPLAQADGRQLPFADGTFGTLVTTFPATYVKHEQTQREFARVLRAGGRWVWVDAPVPRAPTLHMAVFTFFNRLTSSHVPALVGEERAPTIPAFDVTVERVPVGPTAVHVWLLQRR